MKHTLHAVICLILSLFLLLPLTACDGGSYRNDLTAAEVCDAVTNALPAGDGWRQVSDQYISASSWGDDYADYMKKVAEYRIVVSENSDMNIDEVGVFKCNSEKDAKAIKEFAQNYLTAKVLQLTPLLESYNTAELPKLENVTVNVMGCYVMYTILGSADTTTAGSAMEKALTPAE